MDNESVLKSKKGHLESRIFDFSMPYAIDHTRIHFPIFMPAKNVYSSSSSPSALTE